MAYDITLTNGQSLVTVADGTTNTTASSLTLVGKNFSGYGEFLNENVVRLLENFSNATSPAAPLQGQMWWNSTAKVLQVYNGTSWKSVSSSAASATAPAGAIVGDTWWDTASNQLKVWNGSGWTTIGPAFTSGTGQSGPVADVVTDTLGSTHVIVRMFVNNSVVAIISKDSTFTPQVAITGFPTISPGYNLAVAAPALRYYGDADNALKLGSYAAADYARLAAANTFTQPVSIQHANGLNVGTSSNGTLKISASGVDLLNNELNKDISLYVNRAGTSTKVFSVTGSTGLATVYGDPTALLGIATKQYVDTQVSGVGGAATYLARDGSSTITGNITPSTTNTRNFGSASLKFATIYATTFSGNASTANYADLAERFAADAVYEPGTVVTIGGPAEVTAELTDLSDDVFGVVSTNPAYLMNEGAGDDATHPAIALHGRVPVRVIGTVAKGDRLVSAGNGVARAAAKYETTPFNVIGRALESKADQAEALVMAVVAVK